MPDTAGNPSLVGNTRDTNINVLRGTLSMRVGIDGVDGRDGFSPTIEIHEDTPTKYVLKITDVNGSYLTPNLFPDVKELEDVAALVASKVDKTLEPYPVAQPLTLSTSQREESYIFANVQQTASKIRLSTLALTEEVDTKIKRKLQTVTSVPSQEDWKIGDFILLDKTPSKE